MKFIETHCSDKRYLINSSAIKQVWEQSNGLVSFQLIGDSEDTFYTSDDLSFKEFKEMLNK